MKIFLKRALGFIFFLLAFLTVIQLAITRRIKNKSIRGHDNLQLTENINADLVFLGSSRCRAHFDPRFFDSTFRLKSVNIGVDGHSEISMAIVRLKEYLSGNKPPRYAILNLDPLAYGGDEKNNKNYVHKNDFARYAFMPDGKDRLMVDYFNFDFFERYIPLYSLLKYQLITDCIFIKNDAYLKYGYEMHKDSSGREYSNIANNMTKHYNIILDSKNVQNELKRLDSLCAINKIRLLCIQTPVYKIIYDEKSFSCPGQICNNLNIPFIVLSSGPIKEFKNNFYNADHLNIRGINEMNASLKYNDMLNSFFGSE